MTGLELGIIVTVGVVILNLVIFSILPIGIKKLVSRFRGRA